MRLDYMLEPKEPKKPSREDESIGYDQGVSAAVLLKDIRHVQSLGVPLDNIVIGLDWTGYEDATLQLSYPESDEALLAKETKYQVEMAEYKELKIKWDDFCNRQKQKKVKALQDEYEQKKQAILKERV